MNLNQQCAYSMGQQLLSDGGGDSGGGGNASEEGTANVYTSLTYNQSTGSLYNLNFNQLDHDLKQASNILYDTEAGFGTANSSNLSTKMDLSTIGVKLESLNSELTDQEEIATQPGLDLTKLNKSGLTVPKQRQKKMKFNNPADMDMPTDLIQMHSSGSYLYPNTPPNSTYYHKQSMMSSSSITSSNSSSTSSSPLSSSSPLNHHIQHHSQLTQLNNQMNNSGNTQINPANTQSKISSQFSYLDAESNCLFTYNMNGGSVLNDVQGMKTFNEELMDKNEATFGDLLDSSMDEHAHMNRVKLKKSKKDPISEYDIELAEAIEFELGLKKQNGPRKNSWGNLSYAELITRAIESSSDQRLTLSQIYDWIVKYVPYFKEKFDRTSSAGWKNSIRHNLSLHNRFIRVQNESSGKSSWWMINPDISKYSLNGSIGSIGQMASTTMNTLLGSSNTGCNMPLMEHSLGNNGEVKLDTNTSLKSENLDSTYETLETMSEAKHNSDLADNQTNENNSKNLHSLEAPKVNRTRNTSKHKLGASKLNSNKSKFSKINKLDKLNDNTNSFAASYANNQTFEIDNSAIDNNVNTSSSSGGGSNSSDNLARPLSPPSSSSSLKESEPNTQFYSNSASLNGMQNVLDASSSAALSSTIPYQTCSNRTEANNNSILRAALQKSAKSSSTPPASSPTPPIASVTASILLPTHSTVNNSYGSTHSINSSIYNNNNVNGNNLAFFSTSTANPQQPNSFGFDNTLFNNYPSYPGSYETAKLPQPNTFYTGQNCLPVNHKSHVYHNELGSNDSFYSNSLAHNLKVTGSLSGLLNASSSTPTSSSTSPSSFSSSSSSSSSSASSSSSNYRNSHPAYSNYYSNQTYQNYNKPNQTQYSTTYEREVLSMNPSVSTAASSSSSTSSNQSTFYDLNRSLPIQPNESSAMHMNTIKNNQCLQQSNSLLKGGNQVNSSYDDLNSYHDLLNNSNSINTGSSSGGSGNNHGNNLTAVSCYYS